MAAALENLNRSVVQLEVRTQQLDRAKAELARKQIDNVNAVDEFKLARQECKQKIVELKAVLQFADLSKKESSLDNQMRMVFHVHETFSESEAKKKYEALGKQRAELEAECRDQLQEKVTREELIRKIQKGGNDAAAWIATATRTIEAREKELAQLKDKAAKNTERFEGMVKTKEGMVAKFQARLQALRNKNAQNAQNARAATEDVKKRLGEVQQKLAEGQAEMTKINEDLQKLGAIGMTLTQEINNSIAKKKEYEDAITLESKKLEELEKVRQAQQEREKLYKQENNEAMALRGKHDQMVAQKEAEDAAKAEMKTKTAAMANEAKTVANELEAAKEGLKVAEERKKEELEKEEQRKKEELEEEERRKKLAEMLKEIAAVEAEGRELAGRDDKINTLRECCVKHDKETEAIDNIDKAVKAKEAAVSVEVRKIKKMTSVAKGKTTKTTKKGNKIEASVTRKRSKQEELTAAIKIEVDKITPALDLAIDDAKDVKGNAETAAYVSSNRADAICAASSESQGEGEAVSAFQADAFAANEKKAKLVKKLELEEAALKELEDKQAKFVKLGLIIIEDEEAVSGSGSSSSSSGSSEEDNIE